MPLPPQVNFPSNFDTGTSSSGVVGPAHLPLVALSPIIHPRIREVRTGLGSSARKGRGHSGNGDQCKLAKGFEKQKLELGKEKEMSYYCWICYSLVLLLHCDFTS